MENERTQDMAGQPVGGARTDPATEAFVAHRSLLFTVAYEMLGSAADAEDVLQESWLRWADVDQSHVRDPRAYLIRVVTRQALNHMRTLSRRREQYAIAVYVASARGHEHRTVGIAVEGHAQRSLLCDHPILQAFQMQGPASSIDVAAVRRGAHGNDIRA